VSAKNGRTMAQQVFKYSVGCDISKDTFNACILEVNADMTSKVKASHKFKNETKGFNEFDLWVNKHKKHEVPISFTMEATGVYYENLAWYLFEQECDVFVLLPYKTKHYLKSLGIKSKNDKIDAEGLSRMGAHQHHKPWKPYSKSIYTLRSLTRQHESVNKLKTRLINQLHANEYSAFKNTVVRKQLKATLKLLEKQLQELQDEISRMIENEDKLRVKYSHFKPVRGIGKLSWATVIAETNGFETFENQGQLVSYSGYDIIENQSGKHVGKTKISKKGNSRIRRILYMPSLVSVRLKEPVLYNLYERVYTRTGIKMKGYVAVQKKLLVLMYHIWKNDKPFDRNHTFGEEESKSLFPLGSEGTTKKSSPDKRATQDEHSYELSPEALFPLIQI
jgi:transposase